MRNPIDKAYTFHNDPGHGWLKVSRSELEVLGVVQNISPCSYQDAQTVYLEEALDAGVFMRAAQRPAELPCEWTLGVPYRCAYRAPHHL
jgi:hypothetical protein